MKILILSPTFPWPLNMGSKIRLYHTLKELSYGNDITLASLVHYSSEMEQVDKVRLYCSNMYPVREYKPRELAIIHALISGQSYRVAKFQSRQFQKVIQQISQAERFDVVLISSLCMANYLTPEFNNGALMILDQVSDDELIWKSYAREGNWIIRSFANWNLRNLRRFQEQVLNYFDVIFSVSEQEAKHMKGQIHQACQVWIVPNGVDIEYFQSVRGAKKEGNVIMLCGSMDVTMNIDAAVYFSQKIFPQVKQHIPNAEFWIVGRNPDTKVQKLTNVDGVLVTGEVEDLRTYYERAQVIVAPFRFGSGTKLKILEAMAMGIPIVSTDVGCQGIEAIPGRHLWVENENEHFAERVVELLKDERTRHTTILSGRALVEEKYSWPSIIGAVRQKLEPLVQARKGEGWT